MFQLPSWLLNQPHYLHAISPETFEPLEENAHSFVNPNCPVQQLKLKLTKFVEILQLTKDCKFTEVSKLEPEVRFSIILTMEQELNKKADVRGRRKAVK